MKQPVILLDARGISLAVGRMAYEILQTAGGVEKLALVGVRTGGVYLARRLQREIERIEKIAPPLGIVDITLYRDDFAVSLPRPEVGPTEIDFKLTDKIVVLVDDVLFTGRTVRAALDALMDHGRPLAIRLAVLVDRRGHHELPVAADVVGLRVDTLADERVEVMFHEHPGVETDAVLRLSLPALQEAAQSDATPVAPPKPAAKKRPAKKSAHKKAVRKQRK